MRTALDSAIDIVSLGCATVGAQRKGGEDEHLDIGWDEGAAGVSSSDEVGCGDEAGENAGDGCEEAKDILDAGEGGVHFGHGVDGAQNAARWVVWMLKLDGRVEIELRSGILEYEVPGGHVVGW